MTPRTELALLWSTDTRVSSRRWMVDTSIWTRISCLDR